MSWRRCVIALVLTIAVAATAVVSWGKWRDVQELIAARAACRSLDVEAAEKRLEALSERDPNQAELAFLLAVAHRRAGSTEKAKHDLKRAAELGWPRKDLLRQRHMIDFQSGEIKEVEPQLRQMLAQGCSDDEASEIYECMVKGYLSDVRLQDAVVCLDYWLDWQPDSVQAHVLKTDVLDAAGKVNEVIAECRKILNLDPNNATARLRLAFTLLDHKDVLGARGQFEEHLARDADDGMARVGLAVCQRRLGEVSNAKAALDAALASDLPDSQRPFALRERGEIALAEKSHEEAKTYLEQSLRLAPSNATTHYILGLVLSRLGHEDDAKKHLDLSRDYKDMDARLSDVLDQVMRNPNDVELRCEAGEIFLDQGDRKVAFMWLLSALRTENWHAPTHRALARYYSEGGDRPMADRHLAWAAQAESGAVADTSGSHSQP